MIFAEEIMKLWQKKLDKTGGTLSGNLEVDKDEFYGFKKTRKIAGIKHSFSFNLSNTGEGYITLEKNDETEVQIVVKPNGLIYCNNKLITREKNLLKSNVEAKVNTANYVNQNISSYDRLILCFHETNKTTYKIIEMPIMPTRTFTVLQKR